MSSSNVKDVSKLFEKININSELIGENLQPDNDYDIITCHGIDENKNKYVKLKIKKDIKKK